LLKPIHQNRWRIRQPAIGACLVVRSFFSF
jgi:hypothetical protein